MVSLAREDVVTPKSVAETAAARSDVMDSPVFLTSAFEPIPAGAFTHLTTHIETTIAATMTSTFFTSATAMTSVDLVTSCIAVQGAADLNRLLINRLAYILEANGLTS